MPLIDQNRRSQLLLLQKKSKKKKTDDGNEVKKPRIKIKAKGDAGDKKGAKRKKREDAKESESDSEDVPRKKARVEQDTDDKAEVPEESSEPMSKFVDSAFWKAGRLQLDGSFSAARDHVTQLGAWELPGEVAADRFADVAKHVLIKMGK